MAAIAVIVGGFFGMISAVTGFFLFNVSLFGAIWLWSVSGLSVTCIVALLAFVNSRARPEMVVRTV